MTGWEHSWQYQNTDSRDRISGIEIVGDTQGFTEVSLKIVSFLHNAVPGGCDRATLLISQASS